MSDMVDWHRIQSVCYYLAGNYNLQTFFMFLFFCLKVKMHGLLATSASIGCFVIYGFLPLSNLQMHFQIFDFRLLPISLCLFMPLKWLLKQEFVSWPIKNSNFNNLRHSHKWNVLWFTRLREKFYYLKKSVDRKVNGFLMSSEFIRLLIISKWLI